MTTYLNKNHTSGVSAYKEGLNYIIVKFKDGMFYLYTHKKTGEKLVERMKALAIEGQGLNAFIKRCVDKKYEKRSFMEISIPQESLDCKINVNI